MKILKINDIVCLTYNAKNLLEYYNRNIPVSYIFGNVKHIKYNYITKTYVINVCWDHLSEETYSYMLDDLEIVDCSPYVNF